LLNPERHDWAGAKVTPAQLIDLSEMVIYSLLRGGCLRWR
jgi:hypothetical protein